MSLVTEILDYLEPRGELAELDVATLRRWFGATASSEPMTDPIDGRPVVGVERAGELVTALAAHESLLLVSPPGVGKSDIVVAAARRAGLPVRSLLGTQLAPEDLTGVPKIEGNRTVFYPPRVVLPEDGRPFCLFLDELPAAAPDVQKAMYSLLLERRIGEHHLPAGSWVVAAGNRVDDGALVRTLSSALVNRLFVIHVRPSTTDWLAWAERANVRADIRAFIRFLPEALMRQPNEDGAPFSTPRAWASLGSALDRVPDHAELRRVLAHGRVSPEDADRFCAFVDDTSDLQGGVHYLRGIAHLPPKGPTRWAALSTIRDVIARGGGVRTNLLSSVDPEERALLLSGLVPKWGEIAGSRVLVEMLHGYLDEIPEDDKALS